MFTVVVSIALGIAANSTIFSMISRFVLRPAPVGDLSILVALQTTHDGDRCCNNFSWPLYTDVREQTHSFSGVAAYYELLPASIGGHGEPERIWGQSATSAISSGNAVSLRTPRSLANPSHSPATRLQSSALPLQAFAGSTSSSILNSGFLSAT